MAGIPTHIPSLETKKAKPRIFDWISQGSAISLTPFQQFTLGIDWTASPLGPSISWPAQLRQMVLLINADPSPAVVFWGEEPAIIYNEPYTQLIGDKHPALQGQDPSVYFSEIWSYFDRLLATQRETGLAKVEDGALLLLNRHGFVEESYFSWKFVPIVDDGGYVVGSHATVVEVTREIISDRRLSTIRMVNEEISKGISVRDLWNGIIEGLEHADRDVPLAMLYSVADFAGNRPSAAPRGSEHSSTPYVCTLEGSIGVSDENVLAPTIFNLQDKTWLGTAFSEAMKCLLPVLLQEGEEDFPGANLDHIKWRGFGVRASQIVVCPIHSPQQRFITAFLVIALNPKRPYDADYKNFIHTLTQQVIMPQVAARLDAMARAKLSDELSTKTIEFKESEMKFEKFTSRVLTGLAILDRNGSPLYCNKYWQDLVQLDAKSDKSSWASILVPQDVEPCITMFERVFQDGGPVVFQVRLKKPWKTPDIDEFGRPEITNICLLCTLYGDLDDDGRVKTAMSCLTDISELKWTEAQLRRRTAEIEEREMMWRNFTDRAPIVLCLINPDGSLEFGNDTWRIMTDTPKDEISKNWGWHSSVLPEDLPKVRKMCEDALAHNIDATLEFRLNRFWEGPYVLGKQEEAGKDKTTILGTIHTILNDDGTVRYLALWLTDISSQKAAEGVLRKKMDEAIHMKQQQERFIDMTSHEMRNPLSAILHCADEIIKTLHDYCANPVINEEHSNSSLTREGVISLANANKISDLPTPLKEAVDAANTIIYCATHQKRIVDDILTLSRLDSDLLQLSPEAVEPRKIFQDALKIFEAELRSAELDFVFQEEASLNDLRVEWILLDPIRLLQVFINLMSNAIKFTRTSVRKRIIVTVSASLSGPSHASRGFKYLPKSHKYRDHTLGAEWGDGEIIYIVIAVSDTGRGLGEDERRNLFQQFKQASPKTHVQYGGTGLGLFISRQLVEMHGGGIGVASEAGLGSTFTFFIKTRRTTASTSNTWATGIRPLVNSHLLGEAGSEGLPAVEKSSRNWLDSKGGTRSKMSDGFHVLVVEDNLVNQKVVSKQLRSYGCVVSVANHGKEALDFIRMSKFWDGVSDGEPLSVVLMDLEMPVMDGLTCVKKIRELEAEGKIRGHVPVIAVTANARKDHLIDAMSAGMDDVITKPYRTQELLKQIDGVVGRYTEVDRNKIIQKN